MKRVCLLLAFVLFGCSLTGCDDPKREDFKRLDEDKAAEVALSYMNEKYDETFYVVKSEKDAAHGYVPGSIQDAWVDVTVAIAGDKAAEKYTVRLSLNEDRENYDIDSDGYMASIVTPWVKKEMDAIVSTLKIPDFFTICNRVHDEKSGLGLTASFPIIQEHDTLQEIAESQTVYFSYILFLPESGYSADIKKKMQELCEQVFQNDFVTITIVTYTNDYYLEFKKAYDNGDETPPGSISYQVHCDEIFIK